MPANEPGLCINESRQEIRAHAKYIHKEPLGRIMLVLRYQIVFSAEPSNLQNIVFSSHRRRARRNEGGRAGVRVVVHLLSWHRPLSVVTCCSISLSRTQICAEHRWTTGQQESQVACCGAVAKTVTCTSPEVHQPVRSWERAQLVEAEPCPSLLCAEHRA